MSPVQVRNSVRLVASVAWPLATVVCEAYTAIAWGVGLSLERSISQGPRVFIRSKARCAAPLCEALTPCRGLRPHHVQRDRIGTWEVSGLAVAVACAVPSTAVRIGKVRSRSR
jgi:hypothetical protein